MSSESYEFILEDEEDAYQNRAQVATIEERAEAYGETSKIGRFSKPRGRDGEGTIWDDMHAQAQVIYRYEAVCPDCGTQQYMDFERIRVPEGVRDQGRIRGERLAWYECAHCAARWNDHTRDRALALGGWVPDREVARPAVVGFRLRSWEMPFISLSKIMAEYFGSLGDPEKRVRWTNHHEARPYQIVVNETTEGQLGKLIDPNQAPAVVPAWAEALTLAVDMQMRDFVYSVMAHRGDPPEDATIEYGRLTDWAALDVKLNQRWPCAAGGEMGLWRAALDTGGGTDDEATESRTQEAYKWILGPGRGRIWATKGMSRKSPGVIVKWTDLLKLPDGRKLPRALRLFFVDTDAFKRLLFEQRFREEAADPLHFHAKTGTDYLRQLLSERLVRDGHDREYWKRVRANHWLDCMVLHLAMTHWQWSPWLTALVQQSRRSRDEKPAERSRTEERRARW